MSSGVVRAVTTTRLTKRAIDAASATGDRYFLWDAQERGFGLLVLASGIKSFVFQYKTLTGRSRRITIGRYGDMTVDEARLRAKQMRVRVRDGSDPAGERAEERAAGTMNDLFDRYLADHVDKRNAASTASDMRRIMRTHLRPAFGPIPIKSITRADVARFHARYAATPRRANLALSVLSKALALAEVWGLRAEHTNPVRGIERYREEHRTRFLRPEEVARLGQVLADAETAGLPWDIHPDKQTSKHLARPENRRSPVSWQVIAAIRLLLFTGARRSEILALEWRHVDREAGMIALPGQKGRARVPHPVSTQAMDVLDGLPRSNSKWVLPRPDDGARHISPEVMASAWNRIRKVARLDDVNLHDLRHTVGTFAAQAGVSAFIVRDLLRHKDIGTSARYANFDADPVRSVSDIVGARLAASLEIQKPPARKVK